MTSLQRRPSPPPRWRGLLLLVVLPLLPACGSEPEAPMPSAETVEEYFTYPGELSVEIDGNVARVSVYQPTEQLRRGGALWAKVGPYVFLFSREVERLMRDHPALGGVEVVTLAPGGQEVARALLDRNAMNELTWRRALNISGLARRDGTERPTLLEDLIRWGEDHTTFEYSPRYVPRS